MSISIPPGYSVSIPVTITDGPIPTPDDATQLTDVRSDDPAKVRVVYPDPSPGIANPARSLRVDMLPGVPTDLGSNFHARYTSPYDGGIRNLTDLAKSVRAPNIGNATLGAPNDPFLTPA